MKTPNAEKRRELAKKGHALPDGSFPIVDKQDLKDAIAALGLGKNTTQAKAHIIKRAKALGAMDLLPSKWLKVGVTNDSLKHSEEIDEFLAHFGVRGMHWGVIREEGPNGRVSKSSPPQTKEQKIAAKAESLKIKTAAIQVKREATAKKFEAKAADAQAQIDRIQNKQYKSAIAKKLNAKGDANIIKDYTKVRDIAVSDADKKRQGKLTSNQKKVIIGAAVVGAIVLTAVVHHNIQSGEFNRIALKGKTFLENRKGGTGLPFAKNSKLADKMDADLVHKLVVKDVNPGYGAIGTKVNCRRCTFAYEMRRRGYDVSATKTTTGLGQTAGGLVNAVSPGQKFIPSGQTGVMNRLYKEGIGKTDNKRLSEAMDVSGLGARIKIAVDKTIPKTVEDISDVNARSIFDTLSQQPNGSRGELGVKWVAGGAHSMAYEIFDGKPVIFDTQAGKKLSSIEDFVHHGLADITDAGITRLDNIPLNEDFLQRWVKNAGK